MFIEYNSKFILTIERRLIEGTVLPQIRYEVPAKQSLHLRSPVRTAKHDGLVWPGNRLTEDLDQLVVAERSLEPGGGDIDGALVHDLGLVDAVTRNVPRHVKRGEQDLV